jgi:hypothetical protein
MDGFLKMDIFFFITTIAVVLITLGMAFVLWRLERILRHMEHVAEQIALESDAVREDLAALRSDVAKGKGRLQSLFGFLKKSVHRRTAKESH